MEKKRGLAFDLEGTMVDFERNGHHAAHLKCAAAVGLTLDLEEAIRIIPHFLGGPDEAIAEDLYSLGNRRLSPPEIKKMKDELFSDWLNTQKTLPTREGIFQFLESVLRSKVPLAVGSASEKGKVYDYIARSGLGKFFPPEFIVTGEDVANTKPAPDIYLEVARRLRVQPENLVVFEDSGRGVQAGSTAGAYVVGMPVYYMPEVIKKLMDSGADKVFSGWDRVNLNKILDSVKSE